MLEREGAGRGGVSPFPAIVSPVVSSPSFSRSPHKCSTLIVTTTTATLLKIKQPVSNLIKGLVFDFYFDYSKLDGPLKLYANFSNLKVRRSTNLRVDRKRHFQSSSSAFLPSAQMPSSITFTLFLTTKNTTHVLGCILRETHLRER